ncbi:uncharacterized protein EDB93DRAFT_1255334 [Suillus bovinus]|uniref:uncharacterized protein n=1 Tax=Suillus bovinus TaxID=48563 RepID=UPI001B8747D2|nr:uncharacterized protein EDB93DRAFT_1255334 [Suillus bovinus]KAG2132148.1 hypothetical protein EDB93DRAFT_1255334 [Suillus bovinus]
MHMAPNTPTTPPTSSSSTCAPISAASAVLDKLQNSPGGFYAATPKLAYRAEYFPGGWDGNILIAKGRDDDQEFIVRGVFQISRNNFYFMPDANFDLANIFHGRLSDVKLSCRLTAGRNDLFKFASEDFPAILDNLRAFEKLVPSKRDYETLSVIHDSLGHRTIKLTHSLFEAKTTDNENQRDPNASDNDATVDSSLGSEFNIATWPVAERCKGHLEDLVSTHEICPLPAYDKNHVLIPPLQYESKLKGALVEVHMAFCHHRINKSKRDIFNSILRELIVLSPPAAMPTSPFKRRRLNAGPSTERTNKGKRSIRGSGSSP